MQFNFDQEARGLWEEFGEEILAVWILDQPGTRPLCWWLYSCPVSARSIGVVNSGDNPYTDITSWALYPGRTPSVERQRQFLEQHGLLAEGE